jgi:uncharacterized membrane protein YdjX (TVP38/TMEM64 family)
MKILSNVKIWIGLLFIGLIIALRFMGVGDYLTLAGLQEKRIQLMAFVDTHYISSVCIFIGIYISIVILALPLAALCTVAGGFLFGVMPGTIYTNIGATIGASLFFLLVRYAFGRAMQERYKDKLRWFNQEMEQYGVLYLITIHFVAVIPFFVMNLLIGLTQVPFWTFVWTTSVGIIPGTLVYAFAGQQLTTISSLQDIFSFNILIIKIHLIF